MPIGSRGNEVTMGTIALIAVLTLGPADAALAAQPVHSVALPPVAISLQTTGPITIDGDPERPPGRRRCPTAP